MSIDDFNILVNRMRNRVMGRSVAPVVKDKELVRDVQKFVKGWRMWSRSAGTLDPLKATTPFVKRYNRLRKKVNASPELKGKKPLPRVKDIVQFEFPTVLKEGAMDLGKAFAAGLGLYAGITLLGIFSNRRQ